MYTCAELTTSHSVQLWVALQTKKSHKSMRKQGSWSRFDPHFILPRPSVRHQPPAARHPAPGTGHPPPGTRGRATAHVRPVVEISLSSTMEIINEKMNAIISIVCPSGTGISNRSIRVVGAETWEVTLESIEGNPSTVPETSKQRQQPWTNRHK